MWFGALVGSRWCVRGYTTCLWPLSVVEFEHIVIHHCVNGLHHCFCVLFIEIEVFEEWWVVEEFMWFSHDMHHIDVDTHSFGISCEEGEMLALGDLWCFDCIAKFEFGMVAVFCVCWECIDNGFEFLVNPMSKAVKWAIRGWDDGSFFRWKGSHFVSEERCEKVMSLLLMQFLLSSMNSIAGSLTAALQHAVSIWLLLLKVVGGWWGCWGVWALFFMHSMCSMTQKSMFLSDGKTRKSLEWTWKSSKCCWDGDGLEGLLCFLNSFQRCLVNCCIPTRLSGGAMSMSGSHVGLGMCKFSGFQLFGQSENCILCACCFWIGGWLHWFVLLCLCICVWGWIWCWDLEVVVCCLVSECCAWVVKF